MKVMKLKKLIHKSWNYSNFTPDNNHNFGDKVKKNKTLKLLKGENPKEINLNKNNVLL